MPLVRRTRATFRSAELGFLGVTVRTTVQTPRLKGLLLRAGDLDLTLGVARPFLTNWLTVGIFLLFSAGHQKKPQSFDRGPRILTAIYRLKSSEPTVPRLPRTSV